MSLSSSSMTVEDVRKHIDVILTKIHQIELQMNTTSDDGVESMKRALNEYISSLQDLYTLASSDATVSEGSEPVEIPLDVVEYVDQGKNPDECMRVIMSSVLQRAQQAKGKSVVFHMLKDSMQPLYVHTIPLD